MSYSYCKMHNTYPQKDDPCWQCIRKFKDQQLEAENKRLKELIERHHICTTCGKQLSEVEWKSVHSCYDGKALQEKSNE